MRNPQFVGVVFDFLCLSQHAAPNAAASSGSVTAPDAVNEVTGTLSDAGSSTSQSSQPGLLVP